MIAAIIQARVSSTRLPRKVLLRAGGATFLEHMIARVKRSRAVGRIVVATTTRREDRRIIRIARRCGVGVFCGRESDVLDRYYRAALSCGADTVVRLTGDCPVIDPAVIDAVVRRFVKSRRRYEYVSNVHPPTFPDGMDVEVFSFAALERAWREARRPSEREHVTSYIASHPEKFRMGNVVRRSDVSALRLCLDEPADAVFLRRLLTMLRATRRGPFGLPEILKLRKRQPALFAINQHITRNEGYQKSVRAEEMELANKGRRGRRGSRAVAEDFSLRRATRRDARFLFNLRNEPEVRRLSLHREPLSYTTHLSWLDRKLAENGCALFIVETEGQRIGQVRYDILRESPAEAEVSIALAAAFRGKGYGHRVLRAATRKFFSLFRRARTVYAHINLGNERSMRSFAKAGYRMRGISRRGGMARREMTALRRVFLPRHARGQS